MHGAKGSHERITSWAIGDAIGALVLTDHQARALQAWAARPRTPRASTKHRGTKMRELPLLAICVRGPPAWMRLHRALWIVLGSLQAGTSRLG